MTTENKQLNRILAGKIMVEPQIYNTQNWKRINKIVVSKVQGTLLNLYDAEGLM